QFDAEIGVTDARYRYLDVLGFGGFAQGLWTVDSGQYTDILYGMAMFVNRPPEYAIPNFPKSLAGPKIAYLKETRLQRFFPGSGYKIAASATYTPIESRHSVFELNLARTWNIFNFSWVTIDIKGL